MNEIYFNSPSSPCSPTALLILSEGTETKGSRSVTTDCRFGLATERPALRSAQDRGQETGEVPAAGELIRYTASML